MILPTLARQDKPDDQRPVPPQPVLSIIIPAYNVAPYIEDAINSALDQTFKDLEVVVVDDGSTDRTPEIIEAVRQRRNDSRLRVVTQANAGLAAARNTGVLHANGHFIGFLDSDDIWMPEKAELQLQLMLQNSEIGITFSHSAYIAEDGRPTGAILWARDAEPSLHSMIRRNHFGNGSTPIVRRDCFDLAGLFRRELRSCEDYELWCRILWQTPYSAVLIDKPLTLYRIRHSSLSFNSKNFTHNADLAVAALREAMPDVPERVLRAGHAEHYRIAAWKAVSSTDRKGGAILLMKACRMSPSLLVRDWRAASTAVSLLLPPELLPRLVRFAKNLQEKLMVPRLSSMTGRRFVQPGDVT